MKWFKYRPRVEAEVAINDAHFVFGPSRLHGETAIDGWYVRHTSYHQNYQGGMTERVSFRMWRRPRKYPNHSLGWRKIFHWVHTPM